MLEQRQFAATLASFSGSRMRSALMRRMVILSISSPIEHGVPPCAASRAARQAERAPAPWLRTRRARRRGAPDERGAWSDTRGNRSFGHPPPFRVTLQRDPDRKGESAGQMGDRSVHRDHEIEAGHRRRRVDEGVRAGVEIGAQRLDPHGERTRSRVVPRRSLFAARSVSPPQSRRAARAPIERRGTGPVGFRIGVALPDDSDLETCGVRCACPHARAAAARRAR